MSRGIGPCPHFVLLTDIAPGLCAACVGAALPGRDWLPFQLMAERASWQGDSDTVRHVRGMRTRPLNILVVHASSHALPLLHAPALLVLLCSPVTEYEASCAVQPLVI